MADNMKEFSNRQEKMVADALGGYKIGGSGAMPTAPGDVKTYDWLVECKTHATSDRPIFFSADVWKKINDEAMATHRKPVLIVDDGSQKANRTWCLCHSKNLNLSGVMLTDLPVTIRKNISCKHDKLKSDLDAKTKQYSGGFFYHYTIYEVEWEGSAVSIMPLSVFKELFEK